jgi:hypothetical protein
MPRLALDIRHESAPGRPRECEVTPEQARRFGQLIHLANVDGQSGSASMAWRMLCQEYPEIGWDYRQRASKHQLPAVARELARKAQGLVSFHRQRERGLRDTGTYTPGMLRRDESGTRRAWAGERASWDDATVNFGVVIPWPYGGCQLSEKYKVKLGRFQLLLCHDEASSFVPAWSHVIRDSQGYRGSDVAAAVMRVSRDVCLFENLVLEGGVWQGRRMERVLAGMGVGLISAKGRPQCKLVENYFNRLWTRLGMEKGLASVGRFRGEEKTTSDLYVKCRAGKADPRGQFPWIHDAVDGVENSVRWLNSDRIESPIYGKWIPEERWSMDMEEHPRPIMPADQLWLAAPVMERRKVTRHGVIATATGPLGLRMRYQFTGPCLWEWEGRDVELYFDPLGAWPLTATIAKPGTTVILGTAECSNPYYEGGIGSDAAKNLREVMRREYRYLWSGGRQLTTSAGESTLRGLDGVVEISRRSEADPLAASDRRAPHDGAARDPRTFNRGGGEILAPVAGREVAECRVSGGGRVIQPPAGGRATPLISLSRKAAAAREKVPNW